MTRYDQATPALSVRQPWAWLILNAGKDVENRDWPTSYRGTVLIHAGKTVERDAFLDVREGVSPATGLPLSIVTPDTFALGGIVGIVDLVDCVRDHPSQWFFGLFGFILANPRHLPFTPCRGQLGFFQIDAATRLALSRAEGSER